MMKTAAAHTAPPFSIVASQPVVCPLGRIVYAGTKWNSKATYGHAPPPDFMRPTMHYLIVYTLEGEADYVDATGVRAVLRKGSLMWTRPGVAQSYGPRGDSRWSEFYVWFEGPLFDTWQAHGFPGDTSRLLFLDPLEYWIARFRSVMQPSSTELSKTPLARLCEFQQILADALGAREASLLTSEQAAWREAVSRKLAQGTLTSPALTEIAASLHMSYSLFRKRFLELTGKTPGQFRSEEIFRQACGRLRETREPLYQIAERFGFHDQFHFSRRFKEVVGLSPREFRRRVPES